MKEEKKDMNQYVRSSGVFWSSLHRWVKAVILIVGVSLGLFVWWSLITGTALFVALIFMGQSQPADIIKSGIVCIWLFLFVALPWLAVMALKWLVYLAARGLVMLDSEAPASDFFFKKQ